MKLKVFFITMILTLTVSLTAIQSQANSDDLIILQQTRSWWVDKQTNEVVGSIVEEEMILDGVPECTVRCMPCQPTAQRCHLMCVYNGPNCNRRYCDPPPEGCSPGYEWSILACRCFPVQ